jgi:iron complex transport system substrate-binding protein
VVAARADMILDYGSVTPSYAALANRLQAQTRVPSLLLDGALAEVPDLTLPSTMRPRQHRPGGA